jgi:hypothetical protein
MKVATAVQRATGRSHQPRSLRGLGIPPDGSLWDRAKIRGETALSAGANGGRECRLPEWIWILLAGAAGGAVDTVLRGGAVVLPRVYAGASGRQVFDPGIAGRLVVGATLSLLLWMLYSTTPDFGSRDFDVKLIAASLIAGVGASSFLSTLVDRTIMEETVRSTSEALRTANEGLGDVSNDRIRAPKV